MSPQSVGALEWPAVDLRSNHPAAFCRRQEDASLPDIRFPDLRCIAALPMLNNNVRPIVVSRRLGRAKASISLDIYGHLIPSLQTEAAKKIGELIIPVAVRLKKINANQ